MTKTIAIIEDEAALAENYRDLFEAENYRVLTFDNRVSAEAHFENELPDLAIVDVGLGSDANGGFTLVKYLRSRSSTLPILFLSHRDSDIDSVSGLRLGADDYLTKDISLAKLSARVTALFERFEALTASNQAGDEVVKVDELELNYDEMRAYWQGSVIKLNPTEFKILACIARRPGHIKSRSQLMEAAGLVVADNTITSYVKRIRQKFQELDASFNHIESDYSAGYRWVK